MKMSTFVLLALGSLTSAALVGCGSPQRPVTFVTSAQAETAVDTVSRTFAAEGQATANVDRQANVVQTEWKDTGFLYGQIQGTPATIVRRFTATIAPAAQGANVVVRVDAKRCPQGGFTIGGVEVRGTCEEMTVIPERFQQELDTLGQKVQQALQAAPAAPRAANAG